MLMYGLAWGLGCFTAALGVIHALRGTLFLVAKVALTIRKVIGGATELGPPSIPGSAASPALVAIFKSTAIGGFVGALLGAHCLVARRLPRRRSDARGRFRRENWWIHRNSVACAQPRKDLSRLIP
jgi:hypothetical protein